MKLLIVDVRFPTYAIIAIIFTQFDEHVFSYVFFCLSPVQSPSQ